MVRKGQIRTISAIINIVTRVKSVISSLIAHDTNLTVQSKAGKNITIVPVSHDLDNSIIRESLTSNQFGENTRILVEGSLYLGGFLPDGPARENIIVMLEPPSLFFGSEKKSSLVHMYYGGQAISESARGLRRMLETIARDVELSNGNLDVGRLSSEMLYLRRKYPDIVIYNEPQAWLRTVWYEVDLIFYYLTKRIETRLFGAFLYSDMDENFISFVKKHAGAINAMTGPYCLLFAFDSKLGKQAQLYTNSQYFIFKSVVERPARFDKEEGGAKTAAELDILRGEEETILSEVDELNRSILFADRLGVDKKQTPCVVFWENLESHDFLVLSFADVQNDPELIKNTFKMMVDIIRKETTEQGENLIHRLGVKFGELQSELRIKQIQADSSAGNLTLEFLKDFASGEIKVEITGEEIIMGDKLDIKTGDISETTGQIFIGKFNDVAADLTSQGQSELAQALQALTEAIAASKELSDSSKKELIETTGQLGQEAAKTQPNKTMLKMLGNGLMTTLRTIPDISKAAASALPLIEKLYS